MPSLFGRLTRFVPGGARDPKEERLTEAFAATLRAAPEAASECVRAMFGVQPPSDAMTVTTQRRTDVGDRVDVELRFGPLASPSLLVWFELKWDDEPRVDQLHRYAAALARFPRHWHTRLALIAPPGAKFPTEAQLAGEAEAYMWHQVGRSLSAWRRRDGRPDSHAHALVGEFIDYLKENSLAEPDALTVTDALALTAFHTSLNRLRTIVTLTEERLSIREVVPRRNPGPGRKSAPFDFYRVYPTEAGQALDDGLAEDLATWQEHAVRGLEWHGRPDRARGPRATGQWAFAAGVLVGDEDLFGGAEYARWRTRLEREGFEYVAGNKRFYVLRYLYPAQLVGGADLQEQADELSEWVVESFAALLRVPPSRDED